jgi:hypothetical protein
MTWPLVRGSREGDNGERRGNDRDDSNGETVHESSFREGFEWFGGGQQVF